MDRASIQERFGIVGESDIIKNVIDQARQVAKTDITVLLQGESGVGKELIAEVLHELSARRHEPMVVVNCGAIPEGLIESELFGAEKGAYTGAVEERIGYFEEAGAPPPRAGNRSVHARRGVPTAAGGRPDRGGNEQGPEGRSAGRPLPEGFVLSAQHRPH